MIDVVVWSGGADSTRLLYELGRQASATNPILAMGMSHTCVQPKKNRAEKRTREKLLKKLKTMGCNIKYQEIVIDGINKIIIGDVIGLLQRISRAVGYKKEFPFLPVKFDI